MKTFTGSWTPKQGAMYKLSKDRFWRRQYIKTVKYTTEKYRQDFLMHEKIKLRWRGYFHNYLIELNAQKR